jgi:hypothetical protein
MSTAANHGGSSPPGPLDRPLSGLGNTSIWDWRDVLAKLAIPFILGLATLLLSLQQTSLAQQQQKGENPCRFQDTPQPLSTCN